MKEASLVVNVLWQLPHDNGGEKKRQVKTIQLIVCYTRMYCE